MQASFPKTEMSRATVVCEGLANKLGVPIKGRRRYFSEILGRRNCKWFCGAGRALAVFLRSNSNTCPNYRMHSLKITHEDDPCDKGCADDPKNSLRTQRAASVAQKRRTMYFGGYASKKQPVGEHALMESSRTLNSLAERIHASGPY